MKGGSDLAAIANAIADHVTTLERLKAEHRRHLKEVEDQTGVIRALHAGSKPVDFFFGYRSDAVSKLTSVEYQIVRELRSLNHLLNKASGCG